ncbi:hypothetical protein SCAR479_01932 [Seiridium cardinale]|uniref:Uncharacterized protein n=1 Tax=Seiridium cardinale TaxID=138064 RepID=A0ABR2Y3T5_9PEZI
MTGLRIPEEARRPAAPGLKEGSSSPRLAEGVQVYHTNDPAEGKAGGVEESERRAEYLGISQFCGTSPCIACAFAAVRESDRVRKSIFRVHRDRVNQDNITAAIIELVD